MATKQGKSEDERISDLEGQMMQVTSQLTAFGDTLADIRQTLALLQLHPGAAQAASEQVAGFGSPLLFGQIAPALLAQLGRNCAEPVPINGFGDRPCDGRSLEVWSATDGQKHRITVNIENTGDCNINYKGTDGPIIEIRPGQKKSITDFTRRFIVDCRGGDGTCKMAFDGSVC